MTPSHRVQHRQARQCPAPAHPSESEKGLRVTFAQSLASVALTVSIVWGLVGGISYVRDVDSAPASVVWPAATFASGLWVVALLTGMLLVQGVTHKLLYAQRLLFWMAGGGVAFLAIEGIRIQADVLGFMTGSAIHWIIGGSMGILIEPLRSLTEPPSPDTSRRRPAGRRPSDHNSQASHQDRSSKGAGAVEQK